jgi:hypothetical protein
MNPNEALSALQPLVKTFFGVSQGNKTSMYLTLDGDQYVNHDRGFVVLVCSACLFAIRCPELEGTETRSWKILTGDADLQSLNEGAEPAQAPSWSRVIPSTISYSNHPMKVEDKALLKHVKALTKDSREHFKAVNAERVKKGWIPFPPNVTFRPAKTPQESSLMVSASGMNIPVQAENGTEEVILDGNLLQKLLSVKVGKAKALTLTNPTRIDFPEAVAVIANLAPRRG